MFELTRTLASSIGVAQEYEHRVLVRSHSKIARAEQRENDARDATFAPTDRSATFWLVPTMLEAMASANKVIASSRVKTSATRRARPDTGGPMGKRETSFDGRQFSLRRSAIFWTRRCFSEDSVWHRAFSRLIELHLNADAILIRCGAPPPDEDRAECHSESRARYLAKLAPTSWQIGTMVPISKRKR
jgi:hypothetical protein